MKTALFAAAALAGFTALATAQEAPALIGDYSANVRPDAAIGNAADGSMTASRSVLIIHRDRGSALPCAQGDYSANVTCESVYSGR